MSFTLFLTAATGSSTDAAMGSSLYMLLPLVLILIIMYFFMIRPQNKKQKETEKQIAALKKGDKVITIGGIHGTVAQTKEKTLVIKVDDNCKIEFNRTAIATVVTEKNLSDDSSKKKDVAKQIKEKDAPESEASGDEEKKDE